jgi:RNA polymerase sigma factor (sigma-70 family)
VPLEPENWARVGDRLLAGDRTAFLKVSRLIGSFLVRWRAHDFRGEWPDLVQEVLLAAVDGLRKGKVHDPEALVGYVAAIARHKLADRLRALRPREAADTRSPGTSVPDGDPSCPPLERVVEVRLLLSKLPEPHRTLIVGVYGEGRTYEAVARETGIPLGTVKRYLRDGLAALRREFANAPR